MRHLLLVAHGSRREESNREVRALADAIREISSGQFAEVRCAFLELAEPALTDALEALIAGGATDVVIVPYFLAAGRHVARDIPETLAQAQRRHPHVRFTTAPYIGAAPQMRDLVRSLVESLFS